MKKLSKINLDTRAFIAGYEQEFIFNIEEYQDCYMIWTLFNTKDLNHPILKKKCEFENSENAFHLFLREQDTLNLGGEYLQQGDLYFNEGWVGMIKGIIHIAPRIS